MKIEKYMLKIGYSIERMREGTDNEKDSVERKTTGLRSRAY